MFFSHKRAKLFVFAKNCNCFEIEHHQFKSPTIRVFGVVNV